MPHTIFLSYCSLDNLLVGDPEVRRVDAFKHKLAEMLEARLGRGTLLWRYLEENAPGQMLEGNTFASLDRSSILVVLASPNYCHHSPWCLRELEAFALKAMNEREGLEKGHRCRIIVVRFMPLEDAQMPRLLQGRVDLPFHAGPRLINPNAEPRNAFNNRVEDVAICIEETLQAFYGGKAEKPAPLEQDLAGRQVFLFLPEPLLWPLHEKIRLELHDRGAILLGEPIGKKDHPHTVTRLVQALALAEVVVSIGTDAKRALPPAAAPLLLQALATDGRQGLPLRWVTWLPNSPLMLDEAESAEGHQNLFKGLQERILSLPPGQGQTVSEVITDLLLKPAFPAKPMPKSSPSLQPAHNPFPGLRPYRREEAAHFHGREEEVQALLQLLGTTRFVAVMGASGSGKSSLVRCGMATALQQAGAKGRKRTNWLICTLTPGVTPLSNLVTSLHHALADVESQKGSYPLTQQEIWRTVERSGLGLARLLRQVRLPASARLLIIVDQFEEVFRNASSPGGPGSPPSEECQHFVNLLLRATKVAGSPIHVVITLRTDFQEDSSLFRGLPAAINNGSFHVSRMTYLDMEQVVERPFREAGRMPSSQLISTLVSESAQIPDQLPILQHTLSLLWAQQPDRGLRLSDYRALGVNPALLAAFPEQEVSLLNSGQRALLIEAERAYHELSPSQQEIARTLFCLVAQHDAEGREVRRLRTLSDVREVIQMIYGPEAPSHDLANVMATFGKPGRGYLVTHTPSSEEDHTVVDISHESLIRSWIRLRQWVQEERANQQRHELLCHQMRQMKEHKEYLALSMAEGGLEWVKSQPALEAWPLRFGRDYEEAQRLVAFLQESVEHGLRTKKEQESMRVSLVKERTGKVRMRWVALGLGVFAICIAAMFADRQGINKALIEKSQSQDVLLHEKQMYADSLRKAIYKSLRAKDALELAKQSNRIKDLTSLISMARARQAEAERAVALEETNEAQTVAFRLERAMEAAFLKAAEDSLAKEQAKYQAMLESFASSAYAFSDLSRSENSNAERKSQLAICAYFLSEQSPATKGRPTFFITLLEACIFDESGRESAGRFMANLSQVRQTQLIHDGREAIMASGRSLYSVSLSSRKSKMLTTAKSNIASFVVDSEQRFLLYTTTTEADLVSIRLDDAALMETKIPLGIANSSHLVLLKGDRTVFCANDDGRYALLNLDNRVPYHDGLSKGEITAVVPDPTGKSVVVATANGSLLELKQNQNAMRQQPLPAPSLRSYVQHLAIGQNGRVLTAALGDGSIHELDRRTDVWREVAASAGHVSSIGYSEDGGHLVVARSEGKVSMFPTGKQKEMEVSLSLQYKGGGLACLGEGHAWIVSTGGQIDYFPLNASAMANALCASLPQDNKNLSPEDWAIITDNRIPYQKPCN